LTFPEAVIQVFCKAPVPGKVKTRLFPQLNTVQAAEVHQRLTELTLGKICQSELSDVELWCSPDTDHVFFAKCHNNYPLALKTQSQGDLGFRMNHALTEGLKKYRQVVLIGCDCPSFEYSDFVAALCALDQGCDSVLAPTEDGGYSLIGLTRPVPELFSGINWGTSEVLESTKSKIHKLKLDCHELPLQWDVDYYEDYLRFLKTGITSSPVLKKFT
jgi:rSAM/selenodomain-associated transferase 1